MRHATRVMLNKAFTGMGIFSIGIMALAMAVLLVPIFRHGAQAYLFRGTVEYRKMMLNEFHRGDADALAAECAEVDRVRAPVYAMMNAYGNYLETLSGTKKREAAMSSPATGHISALTACSAAENTSLTSMKRL